MPPPLTRGRRRGFSTRAPALLALFALLLLLVAAAGWVSRSSSRGGIGVAASASSMPLSSSLSSSTPPPPPPLLLRSGTVDVRPGRGLMATRLSHSVGRRLLSEASSSLSSSEVTTTIAATTDARWGPLRSGSPRPLRALVSRLLVRASSSLGASGRRTHSSSSAASSSASSPRQLVVAFSSAPPPHGAAEALSKVLRRFGGSLGSFLPEASFVAVGNGRAAAAVLASVPGVAAVGELPPESKLAPELVGDVLLVGSDGGGDGGDHQGEEEERARTTVLAVVFPRLGRAAGGTGGGGGRGCGDEGYDPSSAALADWAGPLSRLAGSGGGGGGDGSPSVRVAGRQGRHVLLVEVVEKVKRGKSSPSLASRVTRWLAAQPATHWLSPASLEASASNWQASAIIQSGKGAPSSPSNAAADAATHPLWAANVTGKNQIIGGGDSGLDLSHCFFADPDVPVELKSVGSSGGGGGGWRGFFGGGNGAGGGGWVFESEKHRKIRLYRSTSSNSPNGGGGNGHGTHTMGSLCGSPFDPAANAKATAYRGMAPDAKLAFSDLSSDRAPSSGGGSKSGRSSGAILVPGDMGGDYYRFAYDAGARVHSDSWGSASLEYDYMASEVDAFAFKHQDFLPVLAAGNEGSASASPSRGVTTVTAPATAKNCIAVGASQSAYAHGAGTAGSAFSLHKLTVSQQQKKSEGDAADAAASAASASPTEVESFRVVQAQFGGRLSSLYGKRLALAAASPPDACGNLDNAALVSGSVLIVARGGCTFAGKAAAAQGAGAVALLVYDDRISDFFIPAASNGNDAAAGRDLTIPAAALPRRVGQLLASAAAASGGSSSGDGGKSSSSPSTSSSSPTRITVSFGPPPSAGDPWDSLADFSSKGPTPDGRIKPDLVAPGVLQSAAAASTVGEGGNGDNENPFFGLAVSSSSNPNDFKCPLRTMQGTSMATPVVAGAAALVRSYFAQGFYPGGSPEPARAFEPGGALVKAVLVAGAAPLDGFESVTGLPLAPPPSYRMGFGRVHLARSLPLASPSSSSSSSSNRKPSSRAATATGWSLQVVDRAPISGGETHRFCLRSTGGPLTVVLAWHDAPGAPSSGRALVNDLDLVVRAAGLGGLPLVGNGGGGGGGGGKGDKDGGFGSPSSSSSSAKANNVPPADRLNNVESVAVAYLPPGDVSIEVRASSVPRGPQPYALAALGEFTGVLASAHNPFVNAQAAAAAAAGGRCDVVVATVRKGPEGVVAKRDVEFEFGTAAGGAAGSFECALVDGGGGGGDKSPSPPPSWKPCSSPVSFKSLEDGKHVFKVRAQGETSDASRKFEVDATPPSLWWRQGGEGGNLPKSSGGGDSSSSSSSSSSTPFLPSAATISFGADDASPVSFRCRLELLPEGTGAKPLPAGSPAGMIRLWTAAEAVAASAAAASGLATTPPPPPTKTSSSRPAALAASSISSSPVSVPGVGRSRAIKLGEWNPNCTSPASFAWLPPGRWRASVDAADAAGNAAPKPLSHEWVISSPFPPSSSSSSSAQRTPFIVSGPYGPSNASSAEFELRALTSDGKLEAVTAADAAQCQLLPLGGNASSTPLSSPPGAPVEGRQPAPAADSAERAWTACGSKVGVASYGKLEDGGYQFAVRFGGGSGGSGNGSGGRRRRRRRLSAANSTTAAAAAATPTTAAPSPAPQAAAPSVAASTKAAASAAGVPPPISAFSVFGVDTTPPNVTISSPPPAILATGSLEVAFAAQEPAAFTCVLTSTPPAATTTAAAAKEKNNGNKKKKPGFSSSAAPSLSITTFPCVSPANYSSLPDGSYLFSVVATDAVGNTSPQKSSTSSSPSPSSASFVVDTLPPDVPPPTLDPPLASRSGNFTATFSGVSDAGSGVAKTQCRLRLLAAAGAGAEGGSTEKASEGSFEDCSSPFAATDLARGRWGLTVRALDAAGNAAESSEVSFYVDDTPPTGASVTSSPPKDKPSPSRVTLSFAAPPDAASAPVTKWDCSLARVGVGGGGGGGEEKENGVSAAAAPRGGGKGGGEEASLSQPRSWQKCSSPAVFKNLKSGNYSFVARATDAAGNVGAPTKASTFAVDASLPVSRDGDGENSGDFLSEIPNWFSSLSGWRLSAVVAGGVALAALLVTAICCCCCSSNSAAARYQRQHPQLQQQQRPQDPDAAALVAALAASARERDAATEATRAREAAALEAAVQASREEELVRRAIERSMVER